MHGFCKQRNIVKWLLSIKSRMATSIKQTLTLVECVECQKLINVNL